MGAASATNAWTEKEGEQGMETQLPDAALVDAARSGDKGAFALLLERHRPMLLTLCGRMLRNADLAQDAAQEAALQAMLSLDSLHEAARFGAWLGGIGLNVCRRWLREHSRFVRADSSELVELADGWASPGELVEMTELGARVRDAVTQLPDGQREAVVLFYLSGLSHAEAAAFLRIEVGAVKARLHKARVNLRRSLEPIWREEHMAVGEAADYVRMRVVDVWRYAAESAGLGRRYVVLLEEAEGPRALPIWIAQFEAEAIVRLLQGSAVVRPLTHTLMASVLDAVGSTPAEVRVSRLAESIFYAEILIDGPRGRVAVDARPSDALTLALIKDVPITAHRSVLEAAGHADREAFEKTTAPSQREWADSAALAAEMEDQTLLREALVESLKGSAIESPQVEAAFRAVRRHLFVPRLSREAAYRDRPIAVRGSDGSVISAASQPSIMATMLECLDLQPGHRVLEIGAGTGYNAALMARLVGPEGRVVTVDIEEDLVAQARQHLGEAGFPEVEVVCRDGILGYAEGAHYDRMILTVGAWDIAPAWADQLRPGGRLVMPLSLNGPQVGVAFDYDGSMFTSASVFGCGFMRLRGPSAGPERTLMLAPDVSMVIDETLGITADQTYRLLSGRYRQIPLDLAVNHREVFEALGPWLGAHGPSFCAVSAQDGTAGAALVPSIFLLGPGTQRTTLGLVARRGLCLLALADEAGRVEAGEECPLALRVYGRAGALAARLVEGVGAWDAAGRPGISGLRISAIPIGQEGAVPRGATVLDRHWFRFVLDWAGSRDGG